MTVRRVENEAEWDAFVADSPQGTFFSTSLWVETVAAAQDAYPCILGVFEDDKLVAGLTCVEMKRGPFTKISTPLLTPYGGLIYRPVTGKRRSEAESFNHACADILLSSIAGLYSYAFLVHSPDFADIRPFTWAGWTEAVRYTYLLDLDNPGRIWDLMERRVRTVLRKAEATLELGGAIDPEQFGALYERIYLDRGRKPPISGTLVKTVLGSLMDAGAADMRTVRDSSGTVISSMVLVSDEHSVYAWISGSLPDRNPTGAFSLLFWDAVRRYSGACERLDMVGANIPSISFFKKGFGGQLRPYYVTERYGSLFSRVVFGLYGGLRKVLHL